MTCICTFHAGRLRPRFGVGRPIRQNGVLSPYPLPDHEDRRSAPPAGAAQDRPDAQRCAQHQDFRELANELGTLLAYEATADLDTEPHTLPGWAGPVTVQRIAGAKITVVPILRAGLGMLSGVLSLIPAARVSVVGLQRDEETLQPVPYFERLTGRLEERDALILDPMLATGGTLIATIDMLKRAGARRIKGIFLVAAPEGIEAVKAVHPDVEIYTAAIDAQLNDKGYILPGLGDAGDRIFGTRVG